jgi:RimJ/RimL family protein N-acetyltransferase
LKLLRLRLKTLEDNARARRCFEKCGFRPCGSVLQQGRYYTLMEMNSQDFLRLATASQEPEGSE